VLILLSLSAGLLVCWIKEFYFIQGIGLLLGLEGAILLASAFAPRGLAPPPKGFFDKIGWFMKETKGVSVSFNQPLFYLGIILLLSSIIVNSSVGPPMNGGNTSMDSLLSFFSISGSVSDMVVAIFAIIAAIFAFKAWNVSKRQLKSQIIGDLLKEYRSVEMGNAIRRLYEEFEQCGGIASKLIESYENKYNSEKHCRESLHHQRRIVSNFYQHVCTLISNGIIEDTILYSLWTKDNLKIIPDILLPIETKAIPHVTHKPEIPIENLPISMKNMLEFFEKKAPDS
jgi:hypothetical protein